MIKDNKRGFFRDIQLDEYGAVLCIINKVSGDNITNNQRQFFKQVRLNESGYLVITIIE
tara:strand:+ start:6892 stop:7068 length:177 start_codon:yes stop_codon:yes gene_type:complete